MAKKDEKPLRQYELRLPEHVYEKEIFDNLWRIYALTNAMRAFRLDDFNDTESEEYVRLMGKMVQDIYEELYKILGRPSDDEYPGRFIEPKGVNRG